MKYMRHFSLKKSCKCCLSFVLACVMTFSTLVLGTSTANAATSISNYLNMNVAGASGSAIGWYGSVRTAMELKSTTADSSPWNNKNIFKYYSDKDATTDYGWMPIILTDWSVKYALTGKVSSTGYTNSASYFTHPLGTSLRGAWISSNDTKGGNTLQYEGAVVSGVKGYNYVVPEGILNATSFPGNGSPFYHMVSYTLDKQYSGGYDYECWYIKYAGEDTDGTPKYFLAAQGRDGVRRLLVYVSDVVCDGNGKAKIESRTVLITAQEYKNNPELYQKRYGWPSSGAFTSYDPTYAHNSVGILQDAYGVEEMRIVNQAYTECFSTDVSDAWCWRFAFDGEASGGIYGIRSCAKITSFNKENSILYAAIQESGTEENRTDKIKAQAESVAAIMGSDSDIKGNWFCLKNTDSGYKFLWSSSTDNKNKTLYCLFGFGYYENTNGVVTGITVKNGETFTIRQELDVPSNTRIVVEQGGTLQVNSKVNLYGKLEVKGTMIVDSGAWIKPTGSTSSMTINGGQVVVCDGGAIQAKYGACTYLYLCNGAALYNNGLVNIPSGQIRVDNSTFNNLKLGVVMLGAFQSEGTVSMETYLLRNFPTNSRCIFWCLDTTALSRVLGNLSGHYYLNSPEWVEYMTYYKNANSYVDLCGFLGNRTTINSGDTSNFGYNNYLVLSGYTTYINNGRTLAFGGIAADANPFIIGSNEIVEYPDLGHEDTSAKFVDYYNNRWGWAFCDAHNADDLYATYGSNNNPYNLALNWSQVKCHVAYGKQVVDEDVAKMANLTEAEYNAKYNAGTPYVAPSSGGGGGGGC